MAEQLDPEHRRLIVAVAGRRQLTEWPAPAGTLVSVGDAETFLELVEDGGRVAVVETQRGHQVPQLVCDTVLDAVRYLVFVLAGPVAVPSPAFAPGCSYDEEGADRVLRWPGGQAVSPRGVLGQEQARRFSWVATADPADIAARRVPVLRVETDPQG